MLMDPLCIYIYRELKDLGGFLCMMVSRSNDNNALHMEHTSQHTSVTFSALTCDPEMKL